MYTMITFTMEYMFILILFFCPYSSLPSLLLLQVRYVMHMHLLHRRNINIMHCKHGTTEKKNGKGSRDDEGGEARKQRGMEKLKCIMYMYQLPMRNVNIRYYKHILILKILFKIIFLKNKNLGSTVTKDSHMTLI